MARLETDVANDDVTKTMNESRALAQALGIRGTPATWSANSWCRAPSAPTG
jgi:hypothetical protein